MYFSILGAYVSVGEYNKDPSKYEGMLIDHILEV